MNLSTNGIFEHKRFDLRNYSRHFCNLDLNKVEDWNDVMDVYCEFIGFIVANGIEIVYEKVFGRIEKKEGFLSLRKKCFDLFNIEPHPLSYIEGHPLLNRDFSSICIYGLSAQSDHFKLTYIPGKRTADTIGTIIEMDGYRSMYLNSLSIEDEDASGSVDFDPVFDEINRLASLYGFLPKDIIRTWIYLSDIKRDYHSLNLSRRKFFAKNHIDFGSNSQLLPASTCIEGTASHSSPVSIDVIFIDRQAVNAPKITRLYNSLQNEANGTAYLFGPTFSRAVLVESEEFSEIQLSGTASIDELGKTVHLGHPFNQIKKAIDNISNLIGQYGFSYQDLCQSTCFIKDEHYYEIYLEVVRSLAMDSCINTFAVTNICREDLLFELDGILIKTK